MRSKILLFGMLFMGTTLMAQAPQQMSYQAVVRDAAGALIANSPVGVRFTIIQGSLSGPNVFIETHNFSTNSNGLITLTIGSGTAVSGTMAAIDWSTGPYFMKTETDPTGGTNYTVSGTTQMMSVPYAMYAETSGNVAPDDQTITNLSLSATDVLSISIENGNTQTLNLSNLSPFKHVSSVISPKSTYSDFVVGTDLLNNATGSASEKKMFFDQSKGAFRAGRIGNTNWDNTNLGSYSFAGGYNTLASGTYSTAFGNNTTASGFYSTVMGNYSVASGFNSFSLGEYTIAKGFNSFVIGQYNDTTNISDLFQLGTGFSNSTRKNAIAVNSSGTTYFNHAVLPTSSASNINLGSSANKWSAVYATNGTIQTSDTTLKTNITPLSYGLADIMKIKTISYTWKNDEHKVQKIGFNAQNLLQIIPEVVQTHSEHVDRATGEITYEENETLGVFYSDMIPVLTKSIQEQQAQIETLMLVVKQQQEQIDKLSRNQEK